MSIRDDRLAANQEPFRSANRGMIEAVNVGPGELVPFLCECADFNCLGRVEATLLEYEEAHGGNDRYFILPGHPRIEGEDIVSENGRYEVVSKAL
ncbi:MAG: hypothetical protein ACRDMW_07265 [Gaiellaceae bacterium]